MTDPVTDALRALNTAAYDALRAGRDTGTYPDLNRQALREIARMTDRLVDSGGQEA
jgi:hypothetical protein